MAVEGCFTMWLVNHWLLKSFRMEVWLFKTIFEPIGYQSLNNDDVEESIKTNQTTTKNLFKMYQIVSILTIKLQRPMSNQG